MIGAVGVILKGNGLGSDLSAASAEAKAAMVVLGAEEKSVERRFRFGLEGNEVATGALLDEIGRERVSGGSSLVSSTESRCCLSAKILTSHRTATRNSRKK